MNPVIEITLESEIRAVVEIPKKFIAATEREVQRRLRLAGSLHDGIKIEPRDLDEFVADETIEGNALTFFQKLHDQLPSGVSYLIFVSAR